MFQLPGSGAVCIFSTYSKPTGITERGGKEGSFLSFWSLSLVSFFFTKWPQPMGELTFIDPVVPITAHLYF